MKITRRALEAAGFITFPVHDDPYLVGGIAFQLTERTGVDKLYFLEAHFLEFETGFTRLKFTTRMHLRPEDPAATKTGFTVTIEDAGDLDLDAVRKFFADAYYRLNCRPDPDNN